MRKSRALSSCVLLAAFFLLASGDARADIACGSGKAVSQLPASGCKMISITLLRPRPLGLIERIAMRSSGEQQLLAACSAGDGARDAHALASSQND